MTSPNNPPVDISSSSLTPKKKKDGKRSFRWGTRDHLALDDTFAIDLSAGWCAKVDLPRFEAGTPVDSFRKLCSTGPR